MAEFFGRQLPQCDSAKTPAVNPYASPSVSESSVGDTRRVPLSGWHDPTLWIQMGFGVQFLALMIVMMARAFNTAQVTADMLQGWGEIASFGGASLVAISSLVQSEWPAFQRMCLVGIAMTLAVGIKLLAG